MNQEVTILRTSRKGIEIEVIENEVTGVKWNIDTAEHDKQIRTDAIEELLKELCIGCAYLNGTKCENKRGCPCLVGQSEIIRSANKVLEQLKEQNINE